MHAEAGYAKRARELGAIGFVAKEDAPTEVVRAFDEADGGFFMSQSVGSLNADRTQRFDAPDDDDAIDLTGITSTERKVLVLLSLGKTSKEIGRDLGVSPRTVQAHRRNISEKLGITGPNRLLEIAIRHRAQLMDGQ
jgi:DNA-binding NarL/FixJ family response regulator